MISEKNKIIKTLEAMPDNITLEEIVYNLYLNSKLEKSIQDIKKGKVMTIKESKERMKKKYANFDID